MNTTPDAIAADTGDSANSKAAAKPGAKILRAIGYQEGLSLIEAGLLLKLVESYWKDGPSAFRVEHYADLFLSHQQILSAFQNLVSRGIVQISPEGYCIPVEFAKSVRSDARRLQALQEYNEHRLSFKLADVGDVISEETLQKFNQFWSAYPKVKGRTWHKTIALRAFVRALRVAPLERILMGLEIAKQSPQWRRDGGQYIPMPSTFLNQRRWEDYIADKQNALASPNAKENARYVGKGIIIGQRMYTAQTPPQREDFNTEREYIEARAKWAVWLAQMG